MTVELDQTSRGFYNYGSPVETTYGEEVSLRESSAADGPHCWLYIKDGPDGRVLEDKSSAHMSLAQAVAIRDRLTAFIDQVPERWGEEYAIRH